MPIPDYETLMWPVLTALHDGEEHRLRDVTHTMCEQFALSDVERQQILPSGQQTAIANRVGWASTYLKKAGLVSSTWWGRMQITEEGRQLLDEHPPKVNAQFLERYPSFLEFKQKRRTASLTNDLDSERGEAERTPEESIDQAYSDLRTALAEELLERVRSCSPQFFERLVVELLVAMGYGGSLADAGKAVGRTGDEGIDGIIKEDKLGLDVVCIQAKRWQSTVGRPEVQAFAGSMEGHRAKKGVLLTTAAFSREAIDYVSRIERKIVLIDGKQLADLMITYRIGTNTAHVYEIQRIDSDYFDEDGT